MITFCKQAFITLVLLALSATTFAQRAPAREVGNSYTLGAGVAEFNQAEQRWVGAEAQPPQINETTAASPTDNKAIIYWDRYSYDPGDKMTLRLMAVGENSSDQQAIEGGWGYLDFFDYRGDRVDYPAFAVWLPYGMKYREERLIFRADLDPKKFPTGIIRARLRMTTAYGDTVRVLNAIAYRTLAVDGEVGPVFLAASAEVYDGDRYRIKVRMKDPSEDSVATLVIIPGVTSFRYGFGRNPAGEFEFYWGARDPESPTVTRPSLILTAGGVSTFFPNVVRLAVVN